LLRWFYIYVVVDVCYVDVLRCCTLLLLLYVYTFALLIYVVTFCLVAFVVGCVCSFTFAFGLRLHVVVDVALRCVTLRFHFDLLLCYVDYVYTFCYVVAFDLTLYVGYVVVVVTG